MAVHLSILAPALSLMLGLACGPATGAEFASKEEAVAIVKKAVSWIKEQGGRQGLL
jgi:hypothetical protein